MAYLTTTSAPQNSILEKLTSAVETLSREIRIRRLYRETFDGLSALGNRELADLGLTRGELRTVAWTSARKAYQ